MVFDFKKEYRELYMPKNKPQIVNVPRANYIAVRGKGDPNEVGGTYQQAISVLYVVVYTLKMSYKTDYKIEGFFDYVVPPLEGFLWQDDIEGVDYSDKISFNWISVIRLPDFISQADLEWAIDKIIDKFLEYITDKKPITARQCIKTLPTIVKYKPNLKACTVDALQNADLSIYKESMKTLILKDIHQTLNEIDCL